MASGSAHQRKAGIEDEPSHLFQEYMQLNQWKVESAVVMGKAAIEPKCSKCGNRSL